MRWLALANFLAASAVNVVALFVKLNYPSSILWLAAMIWWRLEEHIYESKKK